MSKLGKDIISALKEAKKKGLAKLETRPKIGKLSKTVKAFIEKIFPRTPD